MIRKVLLSTVAFAAISGTAFAADLPSRRAPPVFVPPPIPVFSWTGFYMGGQVGYGFGRDRTNLFNGIGGPGTGVAFDIGNPSGIIGGAHVGYNFSTQSLGGLGAPFLGPLAGAGGLIIGAEADIDGTDWRATQGFAGGKATFTETTRKQIEGSARGRVGFAVDRALFYATGGAAFTQFQNSYSTTGVPGAGFSNFTHSRIGWTVGGGAEYAITTQFSLRAEYRYSDFGHFIDAPIPLATVTAKRIIGYGSTHREIQQRVQVGFSYKFDTAAPAPVVARY